MNPMTTAFLQKVGLLEVARPHGTSANGIRVRDMRLLSSVVCAASCHYMQIASGCGTALWSGHVLWSNQVVMAKQSRLLRKRSVHNGQPVATRESTYRSMPCFSLWSWLGTELLREHNARPRGGVCGPLCCLPRCSCIMTSVVK